MGRQCSLQSRNHPKKRLALVIGNAKYASGEPAPTAVNDADDITTSLRQLGFDVLAYKNVDKTAMQQAISEFSTKLKGYQVGLVYYAGHGVQLNGQQFLLPTDAYPLKETDVGPMCLQTSQLITDVAAAAATTNIILLDTDRNNPFSEGTSRNSGSFLDTPVGFVVAQATAPGRTMAEGTGRNSLYTEALLRAMSVPNQTLSQVFQHVRADVLRQSKNKQMPWESTSLARDFYFLKN